MPPVIRKTPNVPRKRADCGDIRCQACWLKLCLIGYQLETELYDRLRSHLPAVIREKLPTGPRRNECGSLLPHRGEILEFNRQVPLSRPLFDGFGSSMDDAAVAAAAAPLKCVSNGGRRTTSSVAAGRSVVALGTADRPRTVESWDENSLAGSGQPADVEILVSKAKHVVQERLPNGWVKKAIKRQTGKFIRSGPFHQKHAK